MNSLRLSTRACRAAEDLIDEADRIGHTRDFTPLAFARLSALAHATHDAIVLADSSLNVGLTWIRGGADTKRSREVMADYTRHDSHAPITLPIPIRNTTKRPDRGNGPSAA